MPAQASARPRRRSLALFLAGGLVAALALASPALAQRPGDTSAIDQYVEDVPTGHGSAIPGQGGGGGGGGSGLSDEARDDLASQGGGDAAVLEEIATNPALTAPTKADNADEAVRRIAAEANGDLSNAGGDDPVSAAVSALTASDGGPLIALFVLLGATTIGMLAVVFTRRRRHV